MTATRPRYADATRCPDCRTTLPPSPFRCPACGLPLQGFLATQLLGTLREADDILDRLRASAIAPVTAAPPTTPPPASALPPPAPRPPARHGLRGASIPRILLGLGATCLLVAAVIFLAVAWTWLGIGGRTAVLLLLTAAAGAAGSVLGGRGLRVAAEALTTVAFGLVVLDLVGADNAGWLGELSFQELLRVVGLGLLVPGVALSLRPGRLVVPQLAAPAGLALGLATVDWTSYAVSAVDLAGPVSVLALAGLCALGRRCGAEVLAWVAGLLAAASWAGAGLWSLGEAAGHPTVRQLWVEGHGWELLLISALSLLLWAVAWSEPLVRQGCAALVAGAVTFAIVLPGLDGTATEVTGMAIAVSLTWALVAAVTPPDWYAVPRVPLAAGAVGVLMAALALLVHAVAAVGSVGAPLTESASVRLVPTDQPLHPLLLLACTAALTVSCFLALPRARRMILAAAGALAVAGFGTLGLYPVPLWVVLAVLAAVAGGLLALALRGRDKPAPFLAAGAGVAGLVLVVAALPSIVLTTTALALVVVGLVLTLALGRFPFAEEVSGLALPAAVGALLWSVAELAEVDPALRAGPALVVLGLLALLLARAEIEVSAAGTGLVAAAVAVPYAADVSVSLAVHLTLAGALVTTSSIVHPSRRLLAWPGGLLLAAATWVRLADLGVEAPEPYTLPSALVLVLVGLYRLRTADDAATVPTLGPGLALATVPSLLWVLADPVTVRAAVLGVACLALLLVGAQLRWHAPVVVGALVGGLVVLRELAPYALQTPQWVLIGTAGTLLIACGITWESRMRNLQHAAAYLGRLR
ncbi:SCO7613 C-terminal domain-containing membrane protein [Nocardioides dilutus]